MVKLHTNHGVITLDLDAAKAPETVANFLQYVKDGFFTNTVFHRVIDGFMIQGGGFEPGMKQKPIRKPVKNEANNGLKNAATRSPWRARPTRIRRPRSSSSTSPTTTFSTTAPNAAGLGLLRVRQSGRRHRRRGQDQEGQNRQPRHHQDVPVEDVVIEKAEVV